MRTGTGTPGQRPGHSTVFASVLTLLSLLLAACGQNGSQASASPPGVASSPATTGPSTGQQTARPPLSPVVKVTVGSVKTTAEAPLYIAADRGYFHDEGLDVSFVDFKTGPDMIAPLGTDQIDAGAGGISAGLFNAIARGIALKMAATLGSTPPGHSTTAFLVRKQLIDSGQVKDFADLRGRKIAVTSLDSTGGYTLDVALQKGGLSLKDVQVVSLGFPDQPGALSTGAIDVGLDNEPFVTRSVQQGIAVRWKGTDDVLPNQQISVLMYAPRFATERSEAAKRFMVAYVRGIRDYVDSLVTKTAPQPATSQILDILASHTGVSRDVLSQIVLGGVDANGRMDEQTTRGAYDWFRQQGYVKTEVNLADVIDNTFVDYADAQLGKR